MLTDDRSMGLVRRCLAAPVPSTSLNPPSPPTTTNQNHSKFQTQMEAEEEGTGGSSGNDEDAGGAGGMDYEEQYWCVRRSVCELCVLMCTWDACMHTRVFNGRC